MSSLSPRNFLQEGREEHRHSPTSAPKSQEPAVTLRLLAYGGERPLLTFGSCTVASQKQARLCLLNETELDRVLTLEPPPTGVAVFDENGAAIETVPVVRRSHRFLHIVWSPGSVGSLCESLRWRMPEGMRLARLEVRLQGTAVDYPLTPRAARAAMTTGARSSSGGATGPAASASGANLTANGARQHAPTAGDHMAPLNSSRAASAVGTKSSSGTAAGPGATALGARATLAVGKAPPRTLSLARPQPAAAAAAVPGSTNTSVLRPAPSLEIPTAANTAAAAASTSTKQLSTPVSSPTSTAGGKAASLRLRPTVSPTLQRKAEAGRALDFRRVGNAESKRERGLLAWMNNEVQPLEATAAGAGGGAMEGHVVRRLLGEVSGKAYLYFKRDDEFAAMASKIEAKIATKQLALKDPATTLSDVRMRQDAVDVLTSYHPFWLAVGLQTVLGKALVLSHDDMNALMHPGGVMPAFLRSRVLDNLLADPELPTQFRHSTNKAEYWEALGVRVLGRVLLLAFLLDRMIQRNDLPAGTPPLFRNDAAIKSSEQLLQGFLQPRLAGAGDVRHSLRMMAYNVEHVQHPRDEADYRVQRPADLRDGTRLAKLYDNLRKQAYPQAASNPSSSGGALPSSAGARPSGGVGPTCNSRIPSTHEDLLPTMAFPQHSGKPLDESQMRNNCLRLARALQVQGINLQGFTPCSGGAGPGLDGIAKSVADGLVRLDQRVTLGILWQMAMHFKLRRHVDVRALERETSRLRRVAAAAAAFAGMDAGTAPASVLGSDDPVVFRYFNEPTSQALLQWIRAACTPHGLAVDDLTWSLSDGRVLCYLIHTYVPEALPRDRVSSISVPSTADEMARMTGGAEYVTLETLKAKGWYAVYQMGGCIHDDGLASAYKRSVTANFAALHAASEALGVPCLLSAEDSLDDGPDELTAILYVALLSEALLKITAERRAAYVIMEYLRRRLSWRPSNMRAARQQYQVILRRHEAATSVQAFWRMRRQRSRYMAEKRAACVLQAYVRRFHVMRQLQAEARRRQEQERIAATAIQAAWRGLSTRKALAQQHAAALVIQRHVRGHLARMWCMQQRINASQHAAATTIQAHWRGFRERRRYQRVRAAVLALQALERMRQARSWYLAAKRGAIQVQAAWRGCQARVQYEAQRHAILRIQAAWRRAAAQKRYQLARLRKAATVIQSSWRAEQARRKYLALRQAVITIQASLRAWMVRRQLQLQERASTVIQSLWRRHKAMAALQAARNAAVAIQARWRALVARRRFASVQIAVIRLQAAWRAHAANAAYSELRSAAVTMQAAWRGQQARRALQLKHAAATTIQTAWRAHVARQRFQQAVAATVRIQAAVRRMLVQRQYFRLQEAAVCVQAAWRARCARMEVQARHHAATLIQASVRALVARRAFLQTKEAAIAVQAAYRGHRARRALQQMHAAATTIQAAWRHHRRSGAATVLQAWWRMVLERRNYQRSRQAVVLLQAHTRGMLARQAFSRARDAAIVIQAGYRARRGRAAAWRQAEAYYTGRQQVAALRLLDIGRQWMMMASGAMRIQACWRGYKARQAYAAMLEQHRKDVRERRAATTIQTIWRGYSAQQKYKKMQDALVVLSNVLVPIYRARRELAQLRRHHETRVRAAVAIQTQVRAWMARRRLLKAVCAATRIQAAWRGHAVRLRDGRAKQEARRRVEKATAEAQKAPHRHIGYRTREALELLLRPNKNFSQIMAAIEVMYTATLYSRDCCKLIARNGGVATLLRFVRSCNRSKQHVDALTRSLAVLHNICRYDALVPDVFHAEDCLTGLSERLQLFRDTEDVFLPAVALLQRLVSREELAAAVPPAVLRHWEGIHQVLFRKADNERKYLERLEGQKGSDISARESARKLVVVQQQVVALEALIARARAASGEDSSAPADIHDNDKDLARRQAGGRLASGVCAGQGGPTAPTAGGVAIPGLKNTLVKDTVQRMAMSGTAAGAVGYKRTGPGGPGSPGQGAKSNGLAGRPVIRQPDA
ncbi:hypothetical protein Agub_g13348 [Astrephomene gubernaculifera]|uniref:Calponin-homology (CH) domain-containing protein n=1 Tax=Astrephomene gubernaculifera TaxID=47775 RepID=A0AAD3HS86_9CHLO|nr:hypothetical protein Agub_g13348 [Astrephomene gubernaculifera]